ncbi:MAG: hypothetical protein Q8N99_07640, partial [Nanoarchaeota archaeon]|nr:hypothetical protein [Nanoarchaeota archaeon]
VISYSGSRWTDNVTINGTSVYTLSDYGSNYILLGDPYAINIPNSKVNVNPLENNIVRLTTGLSPTEGSYPGSEHNKIIYTIIKKMISYSPLSTYAKGCKWTVEFEDGDRLTMSLPSNYGGTDACNYTSDDYDSPGSDDALKIAIYKLFQKLDDNPPYGVLDLKFEEHNLNVSSSVITGIPYPWETVIQVRKWW